MMKRAKAKASAARPKRAGARDAQRRSDVLVRVQKEEFSLARLLLSVRRPEAGAVVLFLGTVKSPHEGKRIRSIEHDAFVQMAETSLREIAEEARTRHSALAVAVVHRRGRMRVGENIVGIATSAVRRADAFDACRYVIEELKKRTPLWKKEFAEDGSWWVEGAEPG